MQGQFVELYDSFIRETSLEFESGLDVFMHAVDGERVYAVGLYTAASAGYVTLTGNTEEGLQRKVADYASKDNSHLALHKASLRWNPCDWWYHENNANFARSQEILNQIHEIMDMEYDKQEMDRSYIAFAAMVAALARADARGSFDIFTRRPVIGVWMGDFALEDVLGWFSLLNDTELVGTYRDEVREGYEAFEKLYNRE